MSSLMWKKILVVSLDVQSRLWCSRALRRWSEREPAPRTAQMHLTTGPSISSSKQAREPIRHDSLRETLNESEELFLRHSGRRMFCSNVHAYAERRARTGGPESHKINGNPKGHDCKIGSPKLEGKEAVGGK